jgi:hypothetical protein
MPKLKLFLFLSIFQIIINIASWLNNIVNDNLYYPYSFDLLSLFTNIGTAFIPFISMITLVFSNMDVVALAFILIFTGLISGIQAYLIIEIVASHVPTVNV